MKFSNLKYHLLCIGSLIVIAGLGFFPVIMGNQTFFAQVEGVMSYGRYQPVRDYQRHDSSSDHVAMQDYEFPSMFMAHKAIRQGEIPLWNPYTGLGHPLIGENLASILNPLKLPILINPHYRLFDFYVILRLVIAGYLMFLLALKMGFSPLASIVTSWLYAFNFYFLQVLTQWHVSVDLWFPLFLFFRLDVFKSIFKMSAVASALVLALMVSAGNPQPILLFMPFALLFPYMLPKSFHPFDFQRSWRRELNYWLITGPLGVAIISPFLVEMLPFMKGAYMFHTSDYNNMCMTLTQYWDRVLSSRPTSLLNWPGMGLGSIGLALLTIRRKPYMGRTILWLACVFFLFQLKAIKGLCLISPIHWFSYLPVYNHICYVKYFGVTYLSLSLLGGLGFEQLVRGAQDASRAPGWREHLSDYASNYLQRHRWAVLYTVIGLLFLFSFGIFILSVFALGKPASSPPDIGTYIYKCLYNELFSTGRNQSIYRGVSFLLTSVFFIVLVFFIPKSKMLRAKVLAFFLAIILIAAVLNRWEQNTPWPGRAPYINVLEKAKRPFRIFPLGSTMYPLLTGIFGFEDPLCTGPIDTIEVYNFLRKVAMPNIKDMALPWFYISSKNPNVILNPGFNVLGVQYFLREPYLPQFPKAAEKDWEKVYDKEVQIWKLKAENSRYFLVPSAQYVSDANTALNLFEKSGFKFKDIAYLEGEQPTDWHAAGNALAKGKITCNKLTMNRMDLSVESDQSTILVTSDAYYFRWKAKVDGKPVKVYRANGALRAVHLAAGSHRVEFYYDSTHFLLASFVSLASIIGSLGYLIRRGRKKGMGEAAQADSHPAVANPIATGSL